MIIHSVYATGTTSAIAIKAFISNAESGVNSCLMIEVKEGGDKGGKLSL